MEACRLFLVPAREARLLLDVDKTFGQTRSGTGNTHALGQDLPRIRALDGCLYCCTQARLRTLPEVLGKRGKKGLQIGEAPKDNAEYRSRCTGPMPQGHTCQRSESGFLT